jgi:acyl-CoA synthetase (AMP-forming)/AMP-acid ligase II
LLQYTSGSTNAPKGAMITETALRANLAQIRARFEHTPASHAMLWTPLHHDMGLVGGVLEPMHSGCPCTLMSPLDFAQRPSRWLRAISRYRATTSGGPTFGYRMCVERIRDDQIEELDLSSWQVAFVGAERVSAPVLRSFAARFGGHGFREGAVLPCYGLAESTLMVASRTKGSGLWAEPSAAQHVSCGAPIAGHELRIVDAASGRAREDGEIGEVWLRGPSLAVGYWGKLEVDADRFKAMLDGVGPYLRTGDLGFMRDGELFITGRLNETIIVRGVKHAPEDLESTVAASHPCFASGVGAAFSCESEHGESFVIACEVRRSAWSETEVEAATAAALEAVVRVHDIRPRAIVLVRPGAIPRTTSGKVQRTLCRELFEHDKLGAS